MEQMPEVISVENIQNKVYVIRGQQVMLDYGLAEIYGYEVKRLNAQVKNNITRFPEDFMFQLTKTEMRLVSAKVSEISVQVAGVIDWKNKAEERFDSIQRSIDTLNENFVSDKDFKNFVIYKGQKFEADAAYIDIYQQAKKRIYVVDDYVNTKTLQLLSQKQAGVEVILFTENGHGKRGFLTTAVVNDFVQQYPPLQIKPNLDCHDRLIVLDYGETTEQAYHCGASSKDAGKKLCAINVIADTSMIHPVIDKLLLAPNKEI